MKDGDHLTDNFGFYLADGSRLLRRRFDQLARVHGLSRAQWQAIAHIRRNEGINQSGLADILELEPISLCRLIDRMEEGGWVRREPDPNDRRARLLFLTDKANAIAGEMRVTADVVYEEALQGFTPSERSQLMHFLSRVRNNLSTR